MLRINVQSCVVIVVVVLLVVHFLVVEYLKPSQIVSLSTFLLLPGLYEEVWWKNCGHLSGSELQRLAENALLERVFPRAHYPSS